MKAQIVRQKAGPNLSTERILTTALSLAEETGSLEKLSLRQIGKALGADPTAIYRYFRSKEELVHAIAYRIYSEMLPTDEQLSGDWRSQLTEIANNVRRIYLTFPAIGLEVTEITKDEGRPADQLIEAIYAALLLSDLPDSEIPAHTEIFLSLAIGIALGEIVFGPDPAAGRERIQERHRKLDPKMFPNLVRFSANTVPTNDAIFETALKTFLDSLSSSQD